MTSPTLIADRYEVLRTLGSGAFGHTLLAKDRQLGREVAVKILHPRAATNWKAFELFEREAAVLRDLRHPGVPAVHTTFRAQWEGAEAAFLVMEYIDGTPLATLIAEHRHLDSAEVVQILVDALGLLEYLHSRVPPILHRDIKPANLILREDRTPALVDFGAVRNVFRADDDPGSTVVGTYGYMPYEQYMGQASASSDLFSLAATFLHLITGRAPAQFMSEAGRLEVPRFLPCDDRLRAVLTRMLATVPGDRFQSAREARGALLGATLPQSAHQPAVPPAGPVTALAPMLSGNPPMALAPAPRQLTGVTRKQFNEVRYTTWELLEPTKKREAGFDLFGFLILGFFCLITAGILPAVVLAAARDRKRRLKPFFLEGIQATAQVLDMVGEEDVGFGIKLKRVRYEFDAGGRRIRDTDQVLPVVADRWAPGDAIEVLYLPDRNYDSVIISTA